MKGGTRNPIETDIERASEISVGKIPTFGATGSKEYTAGLSFFLSFSLFLVSEQRHNRRRIADARVAAI